MSSVPLPFVEAPGDPEDRLSLRQRGNLRELERTLYARWDLGRNLVLAWCADGDAVLLLVVPHSAVAEYSGRCAPTAGAAASPDSAQDFIMHLLSSARRFGRRQIDNAARLLDTELVRARLRMPLTGDADETAAIERLVRRYSISYVHDRAVALFDIVGFSLLSPFEQMTQRNSLACSLNAAHSRLLDRRVRINFARMTTGDGFYIWNRDTGLEANTNLYHFMHLVLADNAIARQQAKGRTVPRLRTSFHVGGCYEYHHAEGLNPTIYTDIVGNVTIELARLIERALPEQILVGEFDVSMSDSDGGPPRRFNAVSFLEHAQATLSRLDGLELSGDLVQSIKCYLTGVPQPDGTFTVRRILVHDKHGLRRNAYNAKVNIHRRGAPPIWLGIEDRQLQEAEEREANTGRLLHHLPGTPSGHA